MVMELEFVKIERCDKETEEVLAEESDAFLNTPIKYVKDHLKEFIYVESKNFEEINVDAISLEVDDVFGTYMALFGFKKQKKYASTIKQFLETHLHTESEKNYSAFFAGDEGLWEIKLPLYFIQGFSEELSLRKTVSVTYEFVKQLNETIKKMIEA